jgi:hypothetical protein
MASPLSVGDCIAISILIKTLSQPSMTVEALLPTIKSCVENYGLLTKLYSKSHSYQRASRTLSSLMHFDRLSAGLRLNARNALLSISTRSRLSVEPCEMADLEAECEMHIGRSCWCVRSMLESVAAPLRSFSRGM